MAIVHPINSAGQFAGDKADVDRPFVIAGSYLQPRRYVDTFTREGLTVTFHGEHRPLQAYTEALADAGFVIERLREPTDPDPAKPWRRIPLFLVADPLAYTRDAGPLGAGAGGWADHAP